MIDFSNTNHLISAVAVIGLILIYLVLDITLFARKRYVRSFADGLLYFVSILIFICLTLLVGIIVIYNFVAVPLISIPLGFGNFSFASSGLVITLTSGTELFSIVFAESIIALTSELIVQILIGVLYLLVIIFLIVNKSKGKKRKWFVKHGIAIDEKAKSSIEQEDQKAKAILKMGLGTDEDKKEKAQPQDKKEQQESDDSVPTVAIENNTIDNLARSMQKDEVDLATGIADEDILPQFDNVPNSEEYFNDDFEIDDENEEYDELSIGVTGERIEGGKKYSENDESLQENDDYTKDMYFDIDNNITDESNGEYGFRQESNDDIFSERQDEIDDDFEETKVYSEDYYRSQLSQASSEENKDLESESDDDDFTKELHFGEFDADEIGEEIEKIDIDNAKHRDVATKMLPREGEFNKVENNTVIKLPDVENVKKVDESASMTAESIINRSRPVMPENYIPQAKVRTFRKSYGVQSSKSTTTKSTAKKTTSKKTTKKTTAKKVADQEKENVIIEVEHPISDGVKTVVGEIVKDKKTASSTKSKMSETKIHKEDSTKDKKVIETQVSSLPVRRRYVVMNRQNAVNVFSDYIVQKEKEEKERLENSLNTIILK